MKIESLLRLIELIRKLRVEVNVYGQPKKVVISSFKPFTTLMVELILL